ncbi:MAG: hypothetical protein ACI841_001080 [Planctomycetota bacterium]
MTDTCVGEHSFGTSHSIKDRIGRTGWTDFVGHSNGGQSGALDSVRQIERVQVAKSGIDSVPAATIRYENLLIEFRPLRDAQVRSRTRPTRERWVEFITRAQCLCWPEHEKVAAKMTSSVLVQGNVGYRLFAFMNAWVGWSSAD